MFIFERLIGIFTYVIVLTVFYIVISRNIIKVNKALNLYLLILSIMAFFYIPPPGEDLVRIKELMTSISKTNFSNFTNLLFNTGYPVGMLMYYLIGTTNIHGLLPALATFITYWNIFYIIKDISKKYDLSGKNSAWLVFFIMSTGMFGYLITNIRTFLAFSILARCIYNEFINKKTIHKNFIWYIIALLTHSACSLIILLRLIYYLIFQSNIKTRNKIFITIPLILLYVIFNRYIMLAMNKFTNYMNESNYFLIYEFIQIISLILYMFMIIRLTRKLFQKNKNELNNICNFIILIIISIIIIREYNVFIRISHFCSMIFLPVLAFFFKNIKQFKYKKIYTYVTLIAIITFLIIAITRGHLSSYKFFIRG